MKALLNRTAVSLFKAMPVNAAKHLLFLAQSQHETLDRWGYHIRPVQYYEPLPDFRLIKKESLERRRNYLALTFNWPQQLGLIRQLSRYRLELDHLSKEFDFDNDFFGGIDAAVYYSLIRDLKPANVLEVGGGYSTCVAEKALTRNRVEGSRGKLRCIEPYPQPRLTTARLQAELITKPVQEVGTEVFSNLQANDILFIDSSHTVKFGSDVCYLFLEVLPTLKPGVWIHVHDIFFPNDYPAEWLLERRLALNEQYLLEAFLAFNRSFEIQLSNHWFCLDHVETAREFWPQTNCEAQLPDGSSFWFTKRAGG